MVSQLTCCGITFGWFDELVVHCQEVHAVQAAPARSPSLEATASQRANSEDWGEGDLDEEDLDEENSEDCQYDEEEDADEQSDLEVDTLHATQHSPSKVSNTSQLIYIYKESSSLQYVFWTTDWKCDLRTRSRPQAVLSTATSESADDPSQRSPV